MVSESNEAGYGTIGPAASSPSPMAQNSGDSQRFWARLKGNLKSDISLSKTHLLLIGLFFVTGLVDSAAYSMWSCFVSMQTGNTLFVGLGVSNQPIISPPFRWTKCLVAILCYLLGSLFFSNFHRLLGPIRKGTLITSFVFQTVITLIVGILVVTKSVSHQITQQKPEIRKGDVLLSTVFRSVNWRDLLPISLLAFQAAGQIVASRVLKHSELPTAVITSLMCDLMSDAHLFTGGVFENSVRNRRTAAAVMLFLGAIVGGEMSKSWVGLPGVLFLAAGIKALMALAWIFWPHAKSDL